MNVVIDGSGFRDALEGLGNDVVRLAGDALELGVDAAARDAFSTNLYRNHTWRLRSSTKASVDRAAMRGRLVNSAPYALWVEDGTTEHPIEARRAPLLRFYWVREGRWFSGKIVQHPGTKPRPFMKHAGQVGEARLHAELSMRLDRATQRFGRAA